MGFASLFKRPKKDQLDEPPKSPEVTKDLQPEQTEESPILSETVVHSFHDVKATSFPPPLSIDASVFTEAQSLIPEKPKVPDELKIPEEPAPISKNGKIVREDSYPNEKKEMESCDRRTCPNLEACEKSSKRQHESKDKISRDRLTEMINVSIKEAVETIAKQCRMKREDDEKVPEKQSKNSLDKTVCHRNDSSRKAKRERSRSAEEYSSCRSSRVKNVHKSSRSPEKRRRARTCPRKKEIANCYCKKVIPCEATKAKKHSKSKPSPGKTDNRRMTGNVNIYICSEATENVQPVNKQKKPASAAESSSETTTEPSNASSCKLVNRIRSKRRKRKEQESSDFLRSTEDSSDPSNPCSCDSKFSDVAAESESTVCTQETESTSTDCRCKDEDQMQSDRSIESTFVVCDKVEQPCSTIYPTQRSVVSDSEEWSSKSGSGAETVIYDQSRKDFDRTPGLMPDYGGYQVESLKRDDDSEKEICIVRRKNVCKCHSGFRSQRRICRSREPVNTCSCIVEEDEDVCETAKESPEITVCETPVEQQVCRRDSKSVEPGVSADLDLPVDRDRLDSEDKRKSVAEEETQDAGQVEDDLDRRPSSVTSEKLIRPEALALKRLIQAKRPSLDQTLIAPSPEHEESPPPPAEEKPEPAFMKKFNLRDKDKFLKHLKNVEDSETSEQTRAAGGGEEIKQKEVEEKKEDEDGAEEKKGFPGRLRTSLFKTFKRVSGKNSVNNDKGTGASDNKTEESDKGVEADQSTKSETEETPKEKKMTLAQRLDINKFFKKKEPAYQKKTASKKKNKQSTKTEPEVKSNTDQAKEEKQDEDEQDQPKIPEEQETNLPLSPDVASKISVPVPPSPNLEETNALPKDPSGIIDVQDPAVKIRSQDTREESKDQKDSEIREEIRPELSKPRILEESREARNAEVCPASKQPSVTVCMRHPQQQRQPAPRCSSQEISIHTVCTNQPLSVCRNVGRSDERIEDTSRCICCCMPALQSCNRLNSFPKSCLKKERQFCRMESQENNCSVLYRDNRSWEECGCRRIVLCEGCCRPRSECSCRPVPCCVTCYKPKTECICNIACPPRSSCRRMKSMVCLYCDRPRDGCTCRSPIRKCSCCEMSVDLCCCEQNRKPFHEGRPVAAELDCDRTMYVTAWKPREDVRRYFSRNLDDLRRDSINECCCREKPKPQNSGDLPYQKLSCFSDVMNELQRKISESVCCTQCRKVPCCCNHKVDEGRGERRIKCCVSPKSQRKTVVCPDKPRSKSPTICKCEPQSRNDRQKKTVVCYQCKSSPCRCKKSKSKKPRMKCYYCKNSPCICIAARERGKPRSCRCADSPCRAKEKEIAVCGKTSAKPKNNEEKMICVR